MKFNLFIVLTLLMVGLVNAGVTGGTCAETGFSYCWESEHVYFDSTSYAKVFFNIKDDSKQGIPGGGYAIKRLYVDVGFEGDKLYFSENLNSWGEIDCDEYGCYNGVEINDGERVLANVGEHYTNCPVFTAWDCDGDCGNYDSPDYWSTIPASRGWIFPNCLDYKVVECHYDADCPDNYICNNYEGDWTTWRCEPRKSCDDVPNYSPTRYTEIHDCVVWQSLTGERYGHCNGGWFYYYPGYVGPYSLTMTQSEYESVVPQECLDECSQGDTKYYFCATGEEIEWCTCSNGDWSCIPNPQDECQQTQEPECTTASDCSLKSHPDIVGQWTCLEEECVWVAYTPDEQNYLLYVMIGGIILFGIVIFFIIRK